MPLTRIRTVRDILWSSLCFIVQVLTFRLSLVLADEDFYRCVIEPVQPPTRANVTYLYTLPPETTIPKSTTQSPRETTRMTRTRIVVRPSLGVLRAAGVAEANLAFDSQLGGRKTTRRAEDPRHPPSVCSGACVEEKSRELADGNSCAFLHLLPAFSRHLCWNFSLMSPVSHLMTLSPLQQDDLSELSELECTVSSKTRGSCTLDASLSRVVALLPLSSTVSLHTTLNIWTASAPKKTTGQSVGSLSVAGCEC